MEPKEHEQNLNGPPALADEVDGVDELGWSQVVAQVPQEIRRQVAATVVDHAPELSARFYRTMLTDPDAAGFLSHAVVEERLGVALQRWLANLFTADDTTPIFVVAAQQRQVGSSHARFKIPINLVGRGARYLKHWIGELLSGDLRLDRDGLCAAVIYVNGMIDLAFEEMNASFVSNADEVARTDEAYRMLSLSQDLAIERERQRAALAEWNHHIMTTALRRPAGQPPLLGQSEFGLWLVHKALFMFERSPEVRQIGVIAERIDKQLVPQLAVSLSPDDLSTLFANLDNEMSEIKFLLTTLFDRYLELEHGRDALTRLLNRRFLPSAMMREIDLAKKTQRMFSVMLIDIDHFKQVNDTYGHDAGDTVLQQVAALIMNTVRSGDFVFRYGGEEMLVILVDVDRDTSLSVAEKIRRKIEQTTIPLSGGRFLNITVSAGLAAYDGHPDYRRIITQADTAVYEAKNAGRNRCVFSTG